MKTINAQIQEFNDPQAQKHEKATLRYITIKLRRTSDEEKSTRNGNYWCIFSHITYTSFLKKIDFRERGVRRKWGERNTLLPVRSLTPSSVHSYLCLDQDGLQLWCTGTSSNK